MRKIHRVAALAVPLVLVMFAGCIEGGDEDEPGDGPGGPASFSEDAGAVEGVVTNDEGLPVESASVALVNDEQGMELATTTGPAGRFTISDVAPGQYTLFVQALGYEAAAQRIDVAVGEATRVEVTVAPIPIEEPYVESLNHNGQYGIGAAVVRTSFCYGCSADDNSRAWFFIPGGISDDFAGMLVEARWETSDSLGFDFLTRGDQCDPSCMWYRTRGESPVRYEVLPCQDYTGPPNFGRVPMPCGEEKYEDFQSNGTDNDAVRLETWYMGQYEQEAHVLDPVCQTQTGPIPGYEAGCYGLGLAPESRWETWVSIYHLEVPEGNETYSAFPDA